MPPHHLVIATVMYLLAIYTMIIPYRHQIPLPSTLVTESTIIATIHCPDVGYCLFGISLVTHILYHVPCTFLIVIVSYWVVPSFARLFTPLAPVPNWDTLRDRKSVV